MDRDRDRELLARARELAHTVRREHTIRTNHLMGGTIEVPIDDDSAFLGEIHALTNLTQQVEYHGSSAIAAAEGAIQDQMATVAENSIKLLDYDPLKDKDAS